MPSYDYRVIVTALLSLVLTALFSTWLGRAIAYLSCHGRKNVASENAVLAVLCSSPCLLLLLVFTPTVTASLWVLLALLLVAASVVASSARIALKEKIAADEYVLKPYSPFLFATVVLVPLSALFAALPATIG